MKTTNISKFNTTNYELLINTFNNFQDDARIWVHVLGNIPTPSQIQMVHDSLEEFTQAWITHKKPTPGSYTIYKGRIVVLINEAVVSGCSIDSSYQTITHINRKLGGGAEYPFYYVGADGNIIGAKREEISNLVKKKTITPNTPIINLQVTKLKELRARALEQPARTTWLAKYFNN